MRARHGLTVLLSLALLWSAPAVADQPYMHVVLEAESMPLGARGAGLTARVRVNARVLWLQLGVVNEDAAEIARNAGLDVVMNRCMKIEHSRLFGCINFIGVNRKLISAKRSAWLPY